VTLIPICINTAVSLSTYGSDLKTARGWRRRCFRMLRTMTCAKQRRQMGNHRTALFADELTKTWKNDPRWKGITRPYTAEDVVRLRGTFLIKHTLARLGAERLWKLLHEDDYVPALGALTGN